ncbi:hypothetical protein KEM60_00291 [Austwickia sp. TVS 96-490-7B]|uniref:hypothetical protein n=1 Tax=Austwickia sp. TVS 96-490-7B TaxID=2830843 RepID=UPI001C568CE2|nr:hypothetical protein [Austwickia sp. TVS 96-490-7B]MBW3084108.1 hypothetical protein [Austwickia sp. TVS 96-490-7B]
MIRYDASTGVIELDGRTLQGFLSWLAMDHSSCDVPDEVRADSALLDLSEAERAGIFVEGRPAPELASLVEALSSPWLVAAVEVTGTGERASHQIWVRPEGGVGVVDTGAGQYRLGAVLPGSLPAVLVRLALWGPRPHGGIADDMVLPLELVDPVRTSGGQAAADALAEMLSPSPMRDDLKAGRWRCVTITTDWSPALLSDVPARSDAIVVMDTPSGLARYEPLPAGIRITPTTMTALWPELIRLTQPASPPPDRIS